MDNSTPGTVDLSDEQCYDLLRATSVGRLAVDIAGQPDIFPINFVVDRTDIVFRTDAGTKLAGAVLGRHVAFEIDGYEPDERVAWSVIVKGVARQIDHLQDLYDAEELPLFPWVASMKPNFVRIDARSVTGRRFHVADDVATDRSLGARG